MMANRLATMASVTDASVKQLAVRRYGGNVDLSRLVEASLPVLRIDGILSETWRGRDRLDMSDFRLGPWRVPRWSILDESIYRAQGEVLYFLLDSDGRIRYVGQSIKSLRTRWRTPPLAAPVDGKKNVHLFHNRAWKPMEAAFARDPSIGAFHLFVLSWHLLVQLARGITEVPTAKGAEGGRRTRDSLSLRVEGWVCRQRVLGPDLWNNLRVE